MEIMPEENTVLKFLLVYPHAQENTSSYGFVSGSMMDSNLQPPTLELAVSTIRPSLVLLVKEAKKATLLHTHTNHKTTFQITANKKYSL